MYRRAGVNPTVAWLEATIICRLMTKPPAWRLCRRTVEALLRRKALPIFGGDASIPSR
jgi:hypothetical protein